MDIPESIVCVECGGVANRQSYPPDDGGFEPGDIVAFACADCDHRMDVVVEAGDDDLR